MENKELPDFKGKVVLFYVKNAPPSCENGIMLEYINFDKRDGRIFLNGRVPKVYEEDWLANCKTVLEWDSVFHYIEFKNLQDYLNRASQYKPTLFERIKRKKK